MRTCTVIPLVILLFVSCAEKEPGHSLPLFRSELNLDTLFADFSGSFLLWRIGSDTIQVYNDVLNHIRSGPASTFKIPHALIALQTGVISPDDNIKKWDGEKKAISSWEADHSLQSAMEHSVVWYFRETARDIGEDRMREYLRSIEYGDQNIDGPIDMFWFTGYLDKMEVTYLFVTRIQGNDRVMGSHARDITRSVLESLQLIEQ